MKQKHHQNKIYQSLINGQHQQQNIKIKIKTKLHYQAKNVPMTFERAEVACYNKVGVVLLIGTNNLSIYFSFSIDFTQITTDNKLVLGPASILIITTAIYSTSIYPIAGGCFFSHDRKSASLGKGLRYYVFGN
jgi:hypothetical protein